MIELKDASLLSLLPFTFKTDEGKALDAAARYLLDTAYKTTRKYLFWGDIKNADAAVLDAMAAEIDAPFYSTDMDADRKRAVIAAAFEYNSRVGSVSAVKELLAAAFGGGEIAEWFEYGGEPYYFKVSLESASISEFMYGYFLREIEKVKPKRAKLEGFDVKLQSDADAAVYTGTDAAVCVTQVIYTAPIKEEKEITAEVYQAAAAEYGVISEMRK